MRRFYPPRYLDFICTHFLYLKFFKRHNMVGIGHFETFRKFPFWIELLELRFRMRLKGSTYWHLERVDLDGAMRCPFQKHLLIKKSLQQTALGIYLAVVSWW